MATKRCCAAELCPDVMLVDIGMKEMNGLELTDGSARRTWPSAC